MWKDFFYFSKSQRFGILILIVLIFVFILINAFMPVFFPSSEPDGKAFITEVESFKRNLVSRDSLRQLAWKNKWEKAYEKTGKDNYEQKPHAYSLFPFNPNIIDSATYVQLGLTSKVASNILKYRNKGGFFKTKESFSKVYGISDLKFKELEPFIRIDEKSIVKTDTTEIFKTAVIVELNAADTTELMKVKGIGRGYAKGIVRYRKMLGGFYSVEQLTEIYGMTSENYEKISSFCTVNNDLIDKIAVNTASIERLNAHPYLNFYQAKAIYELRRRKGKIKSVADFKNLTELSAENITNIQPYLNFD
ncbi:MAG: helix-hairpin-helix domain-containing protein [Paludibacter sp.]|nr:helix-hairpin-helix domain-containing protein [Paludibacter sp.]